jgi:hypothetical protein
MAEETTQIERSETTLVKKGEIEQLLADQIKKNQDIVNDIEAIIPNIRDETIKKGLIKKFGESQERLIALKAGFVPIDGGWFMKTDTKSSWLKKAVKASVESMPAEVQLIWKKLMKEGVFKSFGITDLRGGDPVLAGRAGNQWFLIAAWINLVGGKAVGFTVRR